MAKIIRVYHCGNFIDENSTIYRIKSIERDKDGIIEKIHIHPDSQTTLASLYKDGYKLNQAVKVNQSAQVFEMMFFLEK